MPSNKDLPTLLADLEWQTLDFKQQHELQHDIAEQMVSFANAQGGCIVFGAAQDDAGRAVVRGVDPNLQQTVRERIARAAQHSVEPVMPVDIEMVEYAGKVLILCWVPVGRGVV